MYKRTEFALSSVEMGINELVCVPKHTKGYKMKNKVVIIGSGCVGSAIGYALAFSKNIEEVVLIDINETLAEGEAMDINSGSNYAGDVVVRAGSYADCRDSSVIVIAAGVNRKPGQTRDDLLEVNSGIVSDILSKLRPFYCNAFVIVVTNPVDALTEFVKTAEFIPDNKLCGTGCMLDSARWVTELAKYLNIKNSRIQAYAAGKHGSGQYLLWEHTRIDGISVDEFCRNRGIEWNEGVKKRLQDVVTNMGTEIISKKGKTQYGIAFVVSYLVNALLQETETLVSVGNVLDNSKSNVISTLAYIGNGNIKDVQHMK